MSLKGWVLLIALVTIGLLGWLFFTLPFGFGEANRRIDRPVSNPRSELLHGNCYHWLVTVTNCQMHPGKKIEGTDRETIISGSCSLDNWYRKKVVADFVCRFSESDEVLVDLKVKLPVQSEAVSD